MNPIRSYNPLRPDVPRVDPRMAELTRQIQAGGQSRGVPRHKVKSVLCFDCVSNICTHATTGPHRRIAGRQQQILLLLSNGLSNRDIAENLGIKESTVKVYTSRLYSALGLKSRFAAGLWARDHLDLLRPANPTPPDAHPTT